MIVRETNHSLANSGFHIAKPPIGFSEDHIAWNLRLLGQEVMLAGTVGGDGTEYMDLLKKRGVDVGHVDVLSDYVTSTAMIGTDTQEHQIAFFHPGADGHAPWPELKKKGIAHAVIGARDASVMMAAVAWCKKNEVPYLFDPGQQIIGLGKDDLLRAVKGSAGVITNGYEWSLLSEKIDCGVDGVLAHAPYLIVTQGEEGMTLYERDGETVLRACKADKFINPTGAGDAVRAGLLAGVTAGWSLEQAAQLGAALASFVVEQEGTQLEKIDLDDIWARAKVTYGQGLPSL
jgi:adenosine kinase